MGSSMAQAFAKCGYPVKVYDAFPAALEKAKHLLKLNQESEVKAGNLTEEESAALQNRIMFVEDLNDLADTDFLVEAIVERLEIKHDFYGKLCKVVSDDAILCSNTSGLSITKIAEAVTYPQRFAGMHWMNPPHIIPLIEIICGKETAEETAEQVKDIALKLGKKPCVKFALCSSINAEGFVYIFYFNGIFHRFH